MSQMNKTSTEETNQTMQQTAKLPYRHNPYAACVTSKAYYTNEETAPVPTPVYYQDEAATSGPQFYDAAAPCAKQQQQYTNNNVSLYVDESNDIMSFPQSAGLSNNNSGDFSNNAYVMNQVPVEETQSQYYNYNYDAISQASADPYAPNYVAVPPQGTLHALHNKVNFACYPNQAFDNLEPRLPKNEMVRMFIGQLPYHVTEMQLGWLVYAFGGGANLYHFERITRTDYSKGGAKVPTGCFHCHMEAEQVPALLELINDKLLIDDTGIWVADTYEQKNYLNRYCHAAKIDKTRRFQGRPYGTVVVQVATSTFDPDTFVPRNQRQQYQPQH